MTEPILHCDQCENRLVNARLVDETYLLAEGEKTIEAQRHLRMFEGECPEHGRRFVPFPNEGHSTLISAKLMKCFRNAEIKTLRKVLPKDQRKIFQAALNGQYAWDDDDLAFWRAALKRATTET
jgi:hypothetical protein